MVQKNPRNISVVKRPFKTDVEQQYAKFCFETGASQYSAELHAEVIKSLFRGGCDKVFPGHMELMEEFQNWLKQADKLLMAKWVGNRISETRQMVVERQLRILRSFHTVGCKKARRNKEEVEKVLIELKERVKKLNIFQKALGMWA